MFGTNFSEWPKMLSQILLIAISVANGIVFSSLIDSGKIVLSTNLLNSRDIIFLSVIVSVMLFDYVPSYTKRANVILRCYPVTALKRQLVNIMIELFSIPKIAICTFILSLFLSSKFFMLLDLVFAFLLVLLAVSVSRIIKGIIELGFMKTHSLFPFLLLGASIFLILFSSSAFRIPLICILIYISNFIDRRLETENKRYKSEQKSLYSILLFPFYISNIRIALIFAFFSKTALLLFALNSSNEVSDIVLIFVISPITVFTYVYNNAWGFFRSIWHQTQIGFYSTYTHAKFYLSFLISPILIEAFLTFTLLSVFGLVDAFYIYVYFISLVNFSIIGFIISINYPINVRDGINPLMLKASTSVYGMLADFILIIIVWAPKWYPFGSLFVIVTTCLLLIYGSYFIKSRNSYRMHKVFEII